MKLKGFLKRVFSYKKKIKNQKGFTLLELLIVVAILATIAGTASMAYNDIDKRASAAAHVAMMDELNKGVRTYRAVQRDVLPTRFDSLLTAGGATAASNVATSVTNEALATLGFSVEEAAAAGTFGSDAAIIQMTTAVRTLLADSGVTALRAINELGEPGDFNSAATPPENCDNANIKNLIESKANMVVAGNVFLSPKGNGCGASFDMTATSPVAEPYGVFWVGDTERLTGEETSSAITVFEGGNLTAANSPAMLLLGMGPSSSLFDGRISGGMTTVPVYRHVAAHEYNRFILVLNVGDFVAGSSSITVAEKVHVVAIVDGALDTKEEELGEWDGQRAT